MFTFRHDTRMDQPNSVFAFKHMGKGVEWWMFRTGADSHINDICQYRASIDICISNIKGVASQNDTGVYDDNPFYSYPIINGSFWLSSDRWSYLWILDFDIYKHRSYCTIGQGLSLDSTFQTYFLAMKRGIIFL